MAEEWISVGDEIVDCASLSLSFVARGLATLSFTIYKKRGEDPPYTNYNGELTLCVGDSRFRGWVQSIHQSPSQDSDATEYKVSAVGIVCPDMDCAAVC